MSAATCRLGELFSTHSQDLSIRSTRRRDMSMDWAGLDTSARCIDVLDASDERTEAVLERVGDTGRGTFHVLEKKPAANPTNEV